MLKEILFKIFSQESHSEVISDKQNSNAPFMPRNIVKKFFYRTLMGLAFMNYLRVRI